METEELTKLVDGIYKNILEKFNPGARQLINAGKAYLKALHGAAAASRVYVDALSRLARQAQLGTWGGSQDVGSALMRIVEVYKEIQEQEMNILKAFYVDLLVPLETNLEKDTKVVQSEQKKFLQQHKTRSETYSKAAATMKKQRKKSRGASKSGLAMDKELKNMQILEEEKSKLDAFCEQSLKNAMTQERRRYGFVLERQCSLAKHYASFHEVALAALHPSVDEWREVAGTREYLPQSVEDMFASRLRQVSFWPEDEENCGSELTMSSQLRKTRSMDSSCLELRLGPPPPPGHPPSSLHHSANNHFAPALSRAKSEANIHASSLSLGPDVPETPPRPRSMAPASRSSMSGGVGGIGGVIGVGGGGSSTGTGISTVGVGGSGWGDSPLARALFAYLSSGENQLSFLEGDLIALMGDRQKGWQFGENLRTQSSGWFPLAYTEVLVDDNLGSPSHVNNGRSPEPRRVAPPCKPPPSRPPVTPSLDELSMNHGAKNNNNNNNNSVSVGIANGTPINVPKSNSSHGIATPTGRQPKSIRPTGTLPTMLTGGRRVQPPVPPVPPPQAVTSLHSSNDSGFSNEPPVQPDIDYSDDEAMRQRRRKTRMDRVEAAERGKQQQQRQSSRENEKSGPRTKEWENGNDSWKTIPRDEKNWQIYRNAMDIWEASNTSKDADEPKQSTGSPKHSGNPARARRQHHEPKDSNSSKEYPTTSSRHQNSDCEATMKREKRSKKCIDRNSQKLDYTETARSSARRDNENGLYENGEERSIETTRRNKRAVDEEFRGIQKQTREILDSEEDDPDPDDHHDDHDRMTNDSRNVQNNDSYDSAGVYKENYESKNYYKRTNDVNDSDVSKRRYRQKEQNDVRCGSPTRDGDDYGTRENESDSTSTDSEDASTSTIPETGRKVEHIAQKLEQTAQKYAREHSPPKFIERRRGAINNDCSGFKHQQHQQDQQRNMGLDRDDNKPLPNYEITYANDNEERSSKSQKYDRSFYPIDRTNENGNNSSCTKQQQQQQQQQQQLRGNASSPLVIKNSINGSYERASFAKNPERKRNTNERGSSARRFENRPKPPFEDAPERPAMELSSHASASYRERRYSEKEDIYGETTSFPTNQTTMDRERGYESNFETKLERNKVMEKIQFGESAGNSGAGDGKSRESSDTRRASDDAVGRGSNKNDTNNNTLKNDRKIGLPRQTTTLGHLAQTGRAAAAAAAAAATFDSEVKSPKLVKRTKSFWRFRRDSDVLEGMALWQHRSLVDIPKMLKRESSNEDSAARSENDAARSRKVSTPEGSPGSEKSIGKESRSSDNTLTNDDDDDDETRANEDHRRGSSGGGGVGGVGVGGVGGSSRRSNNYNEEQLQQQRQDEPKPAERIHVPEKNDYYESDFPTPAERPKLAERTDYRNQRAERSLFVGNVSRRAIIEKERKRSLEAKRNMVVAELKENNEAARAGDRRNNKLYGDDDDGLIQGFSETEASDEESTYSCIIVKDRRAVAEKTLLPRTKLRRDSERDKNTCGPWYDLWGVDNSVAKKKNM